MVGVPLNSKAELIGSLEAIDRSSDKKLLIYWADVLWNIRGGEWYYQKLGSCKISAEL